MSTILAIDLEQWRDVVGWEGLYLVSDQGRVASPPKATRKSALIMSPSPSKRGGYPTVSLRRPGLRKIAAVHVLMLEAFVGPRPPGAYGLHADDRAEHLTLSNLRWGSPSDNSFDAVRNGRHPMSRKTHCKRGHAFTPENTWISPSSGGRTCRACRSERGNR